MSDEEWQQLREVCFKRALPPEALFRPSECKQASLKAKRDAAMRELARYGWRVTQLLRVCPISRRSVERITKEARQ